MGRIKGKSLTYSTEGRFEVFWDEDGWTCHLPCVSEVNGPWVMADSATTPKQAFLNVHGAARSMGMEFYPVVAVTNVGSFDRAEVEAQIAETVGSITKYMRKN